MRRMDVLSMLSRLNINKYIYPNGSIDSYSIYLGLSFIWTKNIKKILQISSIAFLFYNFMILLLTIKIFII